MKIYECLLAGDVRGLHPMQISRETGISYREVARRLDATPELFVRLVVARGSHRRYALHTRARAMQRRDVQQLLDRGVLRGWRVPCPGAVPLGAADSRRHLSILTADALYYA